jgi:hypothetical protein
MNVFNSITGSLLVVSFFIKGIFHYMHDRAMANPIKSVSYYFLAFPIVDNNTSVYKPIVAFSVICQYVIVTAGLIQNRELLIQIWRDREKIP